jgi:hypothetical protein
MWILTRTLQLRLALVASAVVLVLAACSTGRSGSGSTGPRSPTSAFKAPTATNSTTSAPSARPINGSGLLAGNARPEFPVGTPGKVDVVTVGTLVVDPSGGATLPVAVRNNTSNGISHVDLSVTAHDSAGRVAATGSSQAVVPAQLAPGEVGLALVYFDIGTAKPPRGATYTFTAETSPADTSSYNTAPVKLTEANLTGGQIVGTGRNTTGKEIEGPYGVEAFCFGMGNQMTDVVGTFANEDGNVQPGGTISFTIDLAGTACVRYLVGASGYFA